MARWMNHVTIATPRNGTSTHSVDPSSASNVVGDTSFTPTAGRLLVCFAEGAVTSTTPSGWTLPSGGSAVDSTGLYVWYRTAAGGDTFSTTHNSSDYPVVFDVYEFLEGSNFLGSTAATGVAKNGFGPTLTGLTGTHWDAGIAGENAGDELIPQTVSWDWGTEAGEYSEPDNSVTDGYTYGLTYAEDQTPASVAFQATFLGGSASPVERLVVSIYVSGDDSTYGLGGAQVVVA